MPEIRVILTIEQDGEELPNMPIVRRYVVNEAAQIGNLIATPDSNTTTFHPIAAAVMPAMSIFLLQTDQALNLEINQNTPLPLNAQGLILILGADLAQATPTDNIEYNNPSASISANLTGLVAGT